MKFGETLSKVTRVSLALAVFGLSLPVLAQETAEKSAPEVKAKVPSAELEPLKIKLPKPMFVGTPRNVRSPNLEKITGKKRKPFLAPKGAKNLALKKEVTGSDEEPIIGEIEQITDGDKEGADGSFVEFGPGRQHVQIDLGKVYEIYAIVVWHYHAQARVYYDVVVRVADDPDFIKGVKTLFNNDHDNSSGLGVGKQKEYIEVNEGRLMDAKGVRARYVRLYSKGSTSNEMNHYVEVDVYGLPLDKAPKRVPPPPETKQTAS
jgi:hypothetical protein